MTRHATPLLALLFACAASSALAQAPASSPASPPAPPAMPRGFVSLNAAYQATSSSFTTSWSAPYYLETESLNGAYSIKAGLALDVGGGVRLWGNLAVGAAVSRFHRSDPASLTATVPHPLLYQEPRSFSGTVSGAARTETAVHVNAIWVIPASRTIQVGVFGGPSVYSITQKIVTGITFAEAYPYTDLTVASTATRSDTKSKLGFNLGTDITVLLSGQVGVGMLIRYTGVTAETPPPTVSTAPNVAIPFGKAGGVQLGAGLRLRF